MVWPPLPSDFHVSSRFVGLFQVQMLIFSSMLTFFLAAQVQWASLPKSSPEELSLHTTQASVSSFAKYKENVCSVWRELSEVSGCIQRFNRNFKCCHIPGRKKGLFVQIRKINVRACNLHLVHLRPWIYILQDRRTLYKFCVPRFGSPQKMSV